MGPCNTFDRIAKYKITKKRISAQLQSFRRHLDPAGVHYLYEMNQKPTAVIFDFGGVLLNLELDSTAEAFSKLGVPDFKKLFTLYHASPVFLDLEIGKIDPKTFAQGLIREIGQQVSEQQIYDAWNTILGDYRRESLSFVEKLRGKMPVYLYSNTNIIHYEVFQQKIAETTPYKHLNDLFNRAYYSHEMGMRKPHAEGYLHILEQEGLNAADTLFVDDNIDNIKGAAAVGLKTHHLQSEERIEKILSWLLD